MAKVMKLKSSTLDEELREYFERAGSGLTIRELAESSYRDGLLEDEQYHAYAIKGWIERWRKALHVKNEAGLPWAAPVDSEGHHKQRELFSLADYAWQVASLDRQLMDDFLVCQAWVTECEIKYGVTLALSQLIPAERR